MKKLLFLLLVLPAFAIAQVPESNSNNSSNDWILMGGLTIYDVERNFLGGGTYSTLYKLHEFGDESSLSIGSHLGLGLSYNNVTGGFLMLNTPVLLHLNLGHKSSTFSDFPIGFSVGLGSDAAIVAISQFRPEYIYGPMLDLNFKIRLPGFRSYTLRASYTENLHPNNLIFGNMLNIGLYSNF